MFSKVEKEVIGKFAISKCFQCHFFPALYFQNLNGYDVTSGLSKIEYDFKGSNFNGIKTNVSDLLPDQIVWLILCGSTHLINGLFRNMHRLLF